MYRLFKLVDLNGDGFIERAEFDRFYDSIV